MARPRSFVHAHYHPANEPEKRATLMNGNDQTNPTPRKPNDLLRFFAYEHLPAHLRTVSQPVGELAQAMDETLPDGAEKTAGLRKLLEAKDCFVRAALPPVTKP